EDAEDFQSGHRHGSRRTACLILARNQAAAGEGSWESRAAAGTSEHRAEIELSGKAISQGLKARSAFCKAGLDSETGEDEFIPSLPARNRPNDQKRLIACNDRLRQFRIQPLQ